MEKSLMTKIPCFIIICCCAALLVYARHMHHVTLHKMEEVEYWDSLSKYNKIYYETKLSAIKKDNSELYDSLKAYKDKVQFLTQFTYTKDYHVTGKTGNNSKELPKKPTSQPTSDNVITPVPEVAVSDSTYIYRSEPNDSLEYTLAITSQAEPKEYQLDIRVKDKITIVNQENGGVNHITIGTDNGGAVSDVTVFKRKEKKLRDRFVFGPTVSAGYDPVNKQFGAMIGVGMTFNLGK